MNYKKTILEYGILALVTVVIFNLILMLSYIPSASMNPMLIKGDIVVGTRYDTENIKRYDVAIFKAPDNRDRYYIKRVIGLPGETITVKSGKVYADGKLLDDSYIKEEMNTTGDGVYKVPEGCYFMMGDNRNDSYDARFWKNKYVPAKDIASVGRFVIFPFNRIKNIQYQGGAS